ncbi:hypothetical protein ACNOYE_10130 [Nannocystaceae bacterium ST9]
MDFRASIHLFAALTCGCVVSPTDEGVAEGESDTSSTDSDSGSSSTDTSSTDADSTDTGEGVMCPGVFPSFDKSCGVDSDCAVVVHTTDCCGNSVAWGINLAEVDAFAAAEAICDGQYPQCDCAAWPTVAEDGNSAEDPTLFAASCDQGQCSSYVPMP